MLALFILSVLILVVITITHPCLEINKGTVVPCTFIHDIIYAAFILA
jgi:hypothetical protein